MTREEATEYLQDIGIRFVPTDQYGDYDDSQPYEEAIDMAIEALSARPTGEWGYLSIKSISRSGVDELQALQCSNCGKWVTTPYMYYPSYHKFCPCCGAKMINSNNGLDMRGGDTE